MTSSAILQRNKVQGHDVAVKPALSAPCAPNFVNPYTPVNGPNLVKLMTLLNFRRGWNTPRSARTYWREAKKLIDDYGPEACEVAMEQAWEVARHPWGIAFVRRLLSE